MTGRLPEMPGYLAGHPGAAPVFGAFGLHTGIEASSVLVTAPSVP
jgi:hypothetical protein